MFSAWQIWLIAAIILFIVELLNASFGIICFAFGAILAAIIDICGLGIVWQLVAFIIGTVLSFLFIRPVLLKWFESKRATKKINLDNMIGRKAIVVQPIISGQGRVAIDGTDWKAIGQQNIDVEAGTEVTIIQREGNTLIVATSPCPSQGGENG